MEKVKEKMEKDFPCSIGSYNRPSFHGTVYAGRNSLYTGNCFEYRRLWNQSFIEKEENDLDGLNYLAGKTVDYVNKSAMKGTMLAM
jgi:hypothetical protein